METTLFRPVQSVLTLICRWTEPVEYFLRLGVDLVHAVDLVRLLALVGLVNADCLNPHQSARPSRTLRSLHLVQHLQHRLGYGEALRVHERALPRAGRVPDVRDGDVRRRVLQGMRLGVEAESAKTKEPYMSL